MVSCTKESVDWKPKAEDPEFLHRSVKQITDIIVHDIFSPPVASRIYAYTSVAGYEAAIHQSQKYISLAGQLNGLEPLPQPDKNLEYCYTLASVQAVLKVGRALIFSEDKLDAFYNQIMQEYGYRNAKKYSTDLWPLVRRSTISQPGRRRITTSKAVHSRNTRFWMILHLKPNLLRTWMQ
jgi:hypothetical protein